MAQDVLIIGGGPAGLACGIALKRIDPQKQILVLEKGGYERFRPGETVPNRFSSLLQHLRLWENFQQQEYWPAYGKRMLWGTLEEQNAVYDPYGPGWHLSRPGFDRWLLTACKSLGVRVIEQTGPIKLHSSEYGWQCRLEDGAVHSAAFLVNATGNHQLPGVNGVTSQIVDQMLGTYFVGPRLNEETYTTIATAQNGWWYHCNSAARSLFTFFTDAKSLQAGNWQVAGDFLSELPVDRLFTKCFGMLDPTLKPNWFGVKSHLSTFTGPNWLAVGDAALCYDPLSGQGIYKAFETAIWASMAICDYFEGEPVGMRKYQRLLENMFDSYIATRAQYYNMIDIDTAFWQNRRSVSAELESTL